MLQNKIFSKKLLTFVVCLLIATFLWVINALNRNYNRFVYIPVKYINLPKSRVITGELPQQIQTEIKASGAKLLFIRFKQKQREITLDVDALTRKKTGKIVAISSQYLLGNISKFLNTEVELIKLRPDSIYFNFGKSFQKVLPVKADLYASEELGLHYSNTVKITPAFVTLSGDSTIISEIDTILTEKIMVQQQNKNSTLTVSLLLPEKVKSRASLSMDKAIVELNMDKYTEASVTIPIEVINLLAQHQLKLFPNKVEIKYQVTLGNFEKINVRDFTVIADYSKINPGKSKLNLELKRYPQEIKILKIIPEKAEYLIRKN